MTWPFSCRACKAKDSEIHFLRGILASTRTIIREPVNEQTVPHYETFKYVPGQSVATVQPDERDTYDAPAFNRNPVQFINATDDTEEAEE